MDRIEPRVRVSAPHAGHAFFSEWRDQFDEHGYIIFERVLPSSTVQELRVALKPYLAEDAKKGRNNFEGLRTNRVYALLAKSPLFADLAIHPLALSFAEHELGADCLLSACLASNLLPGESAQPWHFDDSAIRAPRPRKAFGVSAFWAIDDVTEENGATEFIPGSHLWGDERIDGAAEPADFGANDPRSDVKTGARPDAVKMTMPAGSLGIAKGTMWHRGGANRSDRARLIITPQYCVGWARQIENMVLAVPRDTAARLPRACARVARLFDTSAFYGLRRWCAPQKPVAQQKDGNREPIKRSLAIQSVETIPMPKENASVTLSVRLMTEPETQLIIDYFRTATAEHLETLGVDPTRLPPNESAWRTRFRRFFEKPPAERENLQLIWLEDDRPVGFSTADKIVFGERASMHLHVVAPGDRSRGVGVECVKQSARTYFEVLRLKRLFCEPNALNVAPNRTLQAAGFRYVKTHMTVPGWINFHQPVTQWVLEAVS